MKFGLAYCINCVVSDESIRILSISKPRIAIVITSVKNTTRIMFIDLLIRKCRNPIIQLPPLYPLDLLDINQAVSFTANMVLVYMSGLNASFSVANILSIFGPN